MYKLLLFLFCCFGLLQAHVAHRILGIGASTIDLLIHESDDFIWEHVPSGKGGGNACSPETIEHVLQISQKEAKIVPGGSAANTIRALAYLGEQCSFYGAIGLDIYGDLFSKNLQSLGIEQKLIQSSQIPTSRVLCLVSPDGQRSFLGFDPKASELHPSSEHFNNVEWVHFEARRLDSGFCVENAMQLAKEAGAKISVDLSSFVVVKQHKEILLRLISQYIDVVFCNESELEALTGLSPEEGCKFLQELCPIAVVTLGSNGCLVGHRGEIISSPAFKSNVIDTTGAGDYFAAGFLHGYLRGYSLERCAQMGNRLGGAIVEVVGAELPKEKWADIFEFIALNNDSKEAHQLRQGLSLLR